MINYENLRTLAKYLRSGELKADFNMRLFSISGDKSTDCGSAGCAVGHGPYAGIPKSESERWHEYSHRVFVDREDKKTWDFLFNSYWSSVDNSPTGVANRIDYVVAGGRDYVQFVKNTNYDILIFLKTLGVF